MPLRLQRTIARRTEVRGIGFLTGADVRLGFCPAGEQHGIVFQRTDLAGRPTVAATIANAVPRSRRTAIVDGEACVEMTEHVMAALAGLRVDNCLVQLDAPEPPGCDGSSLAFAEALLAAGFVEQSAPRGAIALDGEMYVADQRTAGTSENSGETPAGFGSIVASPPERDGLVVSFRLDYGPRCPIPPQYFALDVTPESFLEEIAFARTFILESEAAGLKAQGYGTRVTPQDLLVFGEGGVIGNRLRVEDECVRHKILDCLGDFALIGCDLQGHVAASRSGHRLNRELVRRILARTCGNDAKSSNDEVRSNGGRRVSKFAYRRSFDIGISKTESAQTADRR